MPPIRNSTAHRRGSSQNIPDLVPSLPAAPQTSCRLLSVLPAEIRNRVYELSLESEDASSEGGSGSTYRRNAYYYRPGYKQPKRIESSLLQTCQQIYSEASLLPPGINEHTFWFYRAPPHVKDASSPLDYFRKMSPRQRAQVKHLHLFTQQYFLENDSWSDIWNGIQMGNEGRTLRGACRIAPKKLTITFRHTDWWHWEGNEPLGIDPFRQGRTRAREMGQPVEHWWIVNESVPTWGRQICKIPCLEEFVIEFETVMRKRDQLDAIVQRALDWIFPMDPSKGLALVAEPQSLSRYTWIGAKEGELRWQRTGFSRPIRPGLPTETGLQAPQEPEESFAAPVLKPFNPQSSPTTEAGSVSESQPALDKYSEEYYVVFLTWKKQIVDKY